MATIRTFSFPFRLGSTSFPQEAQTDDEAIKSSLIQIVTTGKKERVMRNGFGCNAFAMLFESDGAIFRRAAERDVRSAIAEWEPRVRVDAVIVESGDELTEPGRVRITIQYTNLLSAKPNSLTVEGVV